MLVTVTNNTNAANGPYFPGIIINNPIVGGFGVSPDAVGGSVSFPLPYPFGHIGPLAAGATKQLPMHPADWHYKSVPWKPQPPSTEWNQLVQASVVTLATAAQTGVRDSEENFIHAV